MIFDDAFLDSLPKDPEEALEKLCERFFEWDAVARSEETAGEDYDGYLEAFAALEACIGAAVLDFRMPSLDRGRQINIGMIQAVYARAAGKLEAKKESSSLSGARDKFRARFGTAFLYEFSEGDLKRIQSLLNALRDQITASELFEPNHKERILNKLESLQKELHKKMSSIDKFWGLIGDAGVVLGKFGKDARPLVDLIREIAEIVWRTQARAEELPSGIMGLPLLSSAKAIDDGQDADD